LEEGIVGLQVVRLDDERVGCGMSSNNGLGWLAEASRKARLVDAGPHISCAKAARNEGSADPLDNVVDAVTLDESSQLAHFVIELNASACNFL
jgi:hypothetical protein